MTIEPIPTSGTAQQSTRFLRPAADAVLIEPRVLEAGNRTWYRESMSATKRLASWSRMPRAGSSDDAPGKGIGTWTAPNRGF